MASPSNLKGKAPMTHGQRLAAKEFRQAPRHFSKYVEDDEEEYKPKRMTKHGDNSHEGKHCKKGMECYICKQVGNAYCVHMKSEEPRKASCYNCGQLGYFALECTDPAPYDLQLLCPKCKMGHTKKHCPKAKGKAVVKDGAETEADQMLKKLYNMTFRRNQNNETPMSNNIASSHDPNGGAKRVPVSPYHTRLGTNIWGPPPKPLLPRATPNGSHQRDICHGLPAKLLNSFDQLFYPQWTPWSGPQILENLHQTINNIPTQKKSAAPQNPPPGFHVNHRMNEPPPGFHVNHRMNERF